MGEILQRTPQLHLPKRSLELTAAYGLAAVVFLSPALVELNITRNHVGDAGVAAIVTAVWANSATRLQALLIDHTGSGVRTGKALAEMLATNTSLTHLDVRGNPGLSEPGKVEAIKQAIGNRAIRFVI